MILLFIQRTFSKNLIILLILLGVCCSQDSLAQELFPVKSQRDTIVFKVISEAGKLKVIGNNFPAKNRFPEIESLEFEENDLVLTFSYTSRFFEYRPEVVRIISLIGPGGQVIHAASQSIVEIDPMKNNTGARVWKSAAANMVHDQIYLIVLDRAIMKKINCQRELPSFKVRDQWLHFGIGAAAISSFIVGQQYKKQYHTAYEKFENQWAQGLTKEESNPSYLQSVSLQKKANAWTVAGLAVFSANAVIYTNRLFSIKRKQDEYQRFCKPDPLIGLSFMPNSYGKVSPSISACIHL